MKIDYFCKLLFEAFIVALYIVIIGFVIQKVFKLNDQLN